MSDPCCSTLFDAVQKSHLECVREWFRGPRVMEGCDDYLLWFFYGRGSFVKMMPTMSLDIFIELFDNGKLKMDNEDEKDYVCRIVYGSIENNRVDMLKVFVERVERSANTRLFLIHWLKDSWIDKVTIQFYEHMLRREWFKYDSSCQLLSDKLTANFVTERKVDLWMYPHIRKLLKSVGTLWVVFNNGVEVGRRKNDELIDYLQKHEKEREELQVQLGVVTGLSADVIKFGVMKWL